MKKTISLLLCLALCFGLLAGCGNDDAAAETEAAAETVEATKPIIPSVRVLVFQPELAESWEHLATDCLSWLYITGGLSDTTS